MQTIRIRLLLNSALAAILGVASICSAKEADLSAYPFVKRLAIQGESSLALGACVLDSDVYATAHSSYANLRIVDDSGVETPYIVREKTTVVTSTREREITTRINNLKELDDNKIEIVVEVVGNLKPAQALELISPLHDFEKLVSVDASQDGKLWNPLVKDIPIVDYTRFIDLRDTRIEIPSGNYKFFRLSISEVTQEKELPIKRSVREALHGETQREFQHMSFRREDFRIDAIKLLGKHVTETGQRPVVETQMVSDFDVDNSDSETVITFKSQREPIEGIRLETPDRNFSRSVCVEGRIGKDFRLLAKGNYRFIDIGRVLRDDRTIKLKSPQRCSEWRITINNQDNPALAITAISTDVRLQEIVFTNKKSSYRLLYGSDETKPPSYDVATIINIAGRSPVATYSLGEQLDNEQFRRFNLRLRVGGKVILTIAILIMVVVLIWGISSAAKRVEDVSG